MPPRKSNVSTAGAEDDGASATASSAKEARDDTLSIEDLNLPKSIVQRLAKGVLPANTSIQKDALLAISKSATVFVNYLTSCAADHAGNHGKKTVMPFHVYEAMQQLEFSFMLPRLEAEVAKFTSIQSDKRNTYRKKVREEKKAAAAGATTGAVIGEGDTTVVSMAGDGDEPAAKKVRLDREAETGDEEEGDGDMGDGIDGEDEEVEDDEIEEEEQEEGEGLVEDLLEEKEEKEEDDEMADGDESD